ncbi:MAG: helix-turn-helix domain-containing protein, partial [Anaerobutyricum soehngenii]
DIEEIKGVLAEIWRLQRLITVHIRHLREKLQDTAEKPKYIKTIWGVGYKI